MDQEQDQAPGNAGSLRERLRGALPRAMKARDAAGVAALRSALAAIDNAEAVDAARAPAPDAPQVEVAGAVLGLRAAEVERRSLTEAQMAEIVRAEVADRRAAARDYQQRGRSEQADRLRAEADVLGSYLSGPA